MVLIACANRILRKQWARSLGERFSVREAEDRAALEKSIASQKPSFLLLDLSLPQLGGVGALPEIQFLSPSSKIILLTSAPDDGEAIDALKAGAKGYCNKDVDPALLLKAVEVVEKGEIWVGRKIIPNLLEELTSITERQERYSALPAAADFDGLTPRERQIAQFVGDGFSNKEIASRLNISDRTVKAHLTSIFRKLKTFDRLRLALLVANYDQADR
jgi:two-component system, NarL family, nitrate/nitrite response regulator NarL